MVEARTVAIAALACLALASGAHAQAVAPSVAAQLSNETYSSTIAEETASDFVFNPGMGSLPNVTASQSTSRMLGQWPALSKQGISQTLFTLGACALRPPHYHLRATGLLYLINGTIQVGFTNEDGTKSYINNLTPGASTIFPQGLVHYQQNLGCEPAQYTISYNSEDPGTQVSVPGLVGLPNEVVAAAMGFANNANGFSSFLGSVPQGKFVANSDPACVAACSAAASANPPSAGK